MTDFSAVWLKMLSDTLTQGVSVSPRGQATLEVPQRTIEVNMRQPVLRVPARKLSYRFMAAEAYWILSGDDRVSTIAPYNSRIADFSDDGARFFGAYGPKIKAQLPYVVSKLQEDPGSRQAGLTIWRESPPTSKDIPCTVAIFFGVRGNELNAHVFMRSSDVWLGIPYDVFNFSMLSHLVCALLNKEWIGTDSVSPGTLYLTAASSHLYIRDQASAKQCLSTESYQQPDTLSGLYTNATCLMETLKMLREPDNLILRWWER